MMKRKMGILENCGLRNLYMNVKNAVILLLLFRVKQIFKYKSIFAFDLIWKIPTERLCFIIIPQFLQPQFVFKMGYYVIKSDFKLITDFFVQKPSPPGYVTSWGNPYE